MATVPVTVPLLGAPACVLSLAPLSHQCPRADSGVCVATVSACVGRAAQAIQDAQTLLALLTDKMMEPREQVGASAVGPVKATQEFYKEVAAVAAHTHLPLTLHRLCLQAFSDQLLNIVMALSSPGRGIERWRKLCWRRRPRCSKACRSADHARSS